MSENRRIGGTFWGFVIGGAIGGIIALLYAPKPGKQLRNDISKKTNEILEDGKKKSSELWESTKTKAGTMIDSAGHLFVTGREKVMSEAEKVKAAIKAGTDAYGEETNMSTTGTGNSSKGHRSSHSKG